MLQISKAIHARKRTFLEQQIWKDVPWEDAPELKEPFDYLCDIICDVAGLLEDTDSACMKYSGTLGVNRIAVRDKAMRCLDHLNDWWKTSLNQSLGTCYERPSDPQSPFSSDENGLLFESVLEFGEFWSCYMLMFHNAARILLLQALEQLSSGLSMNELERPLEESNSSPLLGISTNCKSLAMEILRCIECSEARSKRTMGSFCVLTPLSIAYTCLEKDSREMRWLLSSRPEQMSNLSGFQVGRHLLRETPPLAHMPVGLVAS